MLCEKLTRPASTHQTDIPLSQITCAAHDWCFARFMMAVMAMMICRTKVIPAITSVAVGSMYTILSSMILYANV